MIYSFLLAGTNMSIILFNKILNKLFCDNFQSLTYIFEAPDFQD